MITYTIQTESEMIQIKHKTTEVVLKTVNCDNLRGADLLEADLQWVA